MRQSVIETTFSNYLISTDPGKIDPVAIHRYLSQDSYWAGGIPLHIVETAIQNSFCIGIYLHQAQIGFARLVTDYATFGYLADVYVLPEHQGRGLSKAMMALIMELDWVKGLRRLHLATRDAQGLYAQFGFQALAYPDRHMELTRPDIYKSKV
jgi:GNAT superfamily N-acetyltransferase